LSNASKNSGSGTGAGRPLGFETVGGPPKSLLLILARELASNVATPFFVVDNTGVLVFYNEAAESLLGQSFSETGAIGPDEWGGVMFRPEDLEGNPITVMDLPVVQTLSDGRPAHTSFRITGLDGVKRTLSVTSFPLFANRQKLDGAVAVFWEDGP
jgi:PAS domain-containing protein